MSTGNMPNPPDQLTTQATTRDVQGQGSTSGVTPAQADTTQSLPLGADIARIIEEQIDVISQQLVYHTQLLMGVSALGTDPVTARNTALIVATALRDQKSEDAEYALANMGSAQIAQVNDRTLPYKVNSQIAGLLQGILLDTVQHAYQEDSARGSQARLLLQRLFQDANEQMQGQSKMMIGFGAPAGGPNARS